MQLAISHHSKVTLDDAMNHFSDTIRQDVAAMGFDLSKLGVQRSAITLSNGTHVLRYDGLSSSGNISLSPPGQPTAVQQQEEAMNVSIYIIHQICRADAQNNRDTAPHEYYSALDPNYFFIIIFLPGHCVKLYRQIFTPATEPSTP